jgi:hypothetical protein
MGRSDLAGKQDLWIRRMQRFACCRLTVAAFCDRERVSMAAFYQWRRKLQTPAGPPAEQPVAPVSLIAKASPALRGFIPVQLLQPAVVEVRLGNGVIVTLPAGDLEVLRQTLDIVGRLPANVHPTREGESC